MGWNDLKLKYGTNPKRHQLLNKAIRDELAGGEAAMDALTAISECAKALQGRLGPEWRRQQQAAAEALLACKALRDAMADEVCRRYEIGGGHD